MVRSGELHCRVIRKAGVRWIVEGSTLPLQSGPIATNLERSLRGNRASSATLISALDSEVRAIHMVFDNRDITPIEKIKRLERRFRDMAELVEDAADKWLP
jgi:hypothetical protein